MQLVAYLGFKGNCEAAFKYYERVFGGKIVAMMKHDSLPPEELAKTPPGWKDMVLHARLVTGNSVLMGSDAPEGRFEKAQGISVSVQVDDPKEAERIFAALADNGIVQMPIQKTFWAIRFGMLVDQFGIPWMVNCEQKR